VRLRHPPYQGQTETRPQGGLGVDPGEGFEDDVTEFGRHSRAVVVDEHQQAVGGLVQVDVHGARRVAERVLDQVEQGADQQRRVPGDEQRRRDAPAKTCPIRALLQNGVDQLARGEGLPWHLGHGEGREFEDVDHQMVEPFEAAPETLQQLDRVIGCASGDRRRPRTVQQFHHLAARRQQRRPQIVREQLHAQATYLEGIRCGSREQRSRAATQPATPGEPRLRNGPTERAHPKPGPGDPTLVRLIVIGCRHPPSRLHAGHDVSLPARSGLVDNRVFVHIKPPGSTLPDVLEKWPGTLRR
jgi:hypothetical protein